ncbi:energy transducer TonB [Rhodanobacter ginsengisoli]|uniref:Energy transducer TonB n=1 Tax=Rhodanobacter ginsengisoli TaxID=418646 RepID=A0ABW0QP79_9GAMM
MMLTGMALAAGPAAVRKRVQASMLVTGSITVAPDGSVKSYVVDQPEQLPSPVIGLIKRSVPTWRFVPVVLDGRPVFAKAAMNLRIVAKPLGDGKYSLGIGSSYFSQPSSSGDPGRETVTARQRRPPNYPPFAVEARVSGTVYLVLRVNRQGMVVDAAAEQVNLDVVANDTEMKRWRTVLADAALRAARKWTYNPPTSGRDAAAPSWVIRVPVEFSLSEWGKPVPVAKYGAWHAYVPGPQNTPAWMMEEPGVGGSADAIPAGSISQVGRGLQMTTSLNGA